MTNTVRLTFNTDTQMQAAVNVHRAATNLTASLVNAAMDTFISSGAFDTRGRGSLESKYAAELVSVTTKDLDVAPAMP